MGHNRIYKYKKHASVYKYKKHASVKVTIAGVLVALLCSGCTTPAAEEVASADSERECRGTGSTGSRMQRPVCMSKEAWAVVDAREAEKEAVTDEFFRRAGEGATLGPGPTFSSPAGAGQ